VAHERALDGRGLAALRRRRSLDGLARARGGEAGTVERATQRATEGVGGATERERRVGRALLDDETRQRAQRGVDPAHDVDAALRAVDVEEAHREPLEVRRELADLARKPLAHVVAQRLVD